MDSFDYVIVGGGAAGCILANRLTESGRHKVLLLEAGGEPRNFWIPIPAGFARLMRGREFNWGFQTEPEENTRNRVIAVPRGRGLGGSTLINGMIYVRGQPGDFDAWERSGARGWGAAAVEPYFRKLEDYAPGGPKRGHGGPMRLHRVSERFQIADAFLEAAQQDGQPLNEDYNDARQDGVGWYQVLQHGGRRWSTYDGYLKPARSRPNLRIETGAHVLRVELDGARCTGVSFRQAGRDVTVKAGIEVIMAAGSVQTPQILELSGIGSPAVLQPLGLPVRHALEGVGENYIDHFCTRMNWRLKDTITLNEMARGWRLVRAVAQYFATRTGILTLGTGLVHGFVRTRPELATPDAQYFFMHATYANAAERILDKVPGMTIGVAQLRPESMGSIHVRSADPFEGPAIRPNFLATETDRQCLVDAMRIARRIVGQPALAPYVDIETAPGPQVKTDDEWLEFGRLNGQTIYHPIGTCRMGEDDRAVVDPRLKLRGIAGLRVADASVMPSMVSGNTQAAVMMVAEKAADLILEDARSA